MSAGRKRHATRTPAWRARDGCARGALTARAARRIMTEEPERLPTMAEHEHYALASPTPDHFLPLLYLAGMAVESETPAEVLIGGYAYGSLSMTSFTVA